MLLYQITYSRKEEKEINFMSENKAETDHETNEIVAYHKVKRIFLSLWDIESEDADQFQICEFKGQNFELVA